MPVQVALVIAQHGIPFSDGDFIENAFLECVPSLFHDFQNKENILRKISELTISRNTIKDRILNMSSDVKHQQKVDINSCDYISSALMKALMTLILLDWLFLFVTLVKIK